MTDKHRYTDNNGRLLEEELTYKIRGCIYNVANKYGKGLKESIYQKALAEEFVKNNILFKEQQKIKIYSLESGKLLGVYVPDFVVDNKIVVELKSTMFTTKVDIQQQRSYLRASEYEIGILVNFNTEKLDIIRSIFTNDRKSFITKMSHDSISDQCQSVNHPCKSVVKAFTLVEVLIVTTILVILAIIALIAINPNRQISKTWDTKRKNDLATLKRVMEDWYNDKNCYPRPVEICYNAVGTTCNICGDNPNSPAFTPYLSKLPCDPEQSKSPYLYQVDDADCPSWFRVYTNIDTNDQAVNEVGCQNGCGPLGDNNYHYGISSPNISLESNPVMPTPTTAGGLPACPEDGLYCNKTTESLGGGEEITLPGIEEEIVPSCKNCGTFENCNKDTSCDMPLRLYTSPDCSNECQY